jgi:hypothetical protein
MKQSDIVSTMQMSVLAAGLFLCSMAVPALAQQTCPTAADLARGIRIEFADGSLETFRAGAPGLVLVSGAGADGATYRMELGRGLYLMLWEDWADGAPDAATRSVYDYAGRAPADLPLPGGGKVWFSPVTVTVADSPYSEAQRHSYGPRSEVDIGGCRR